MSSYGDHLSNVAQERLESLKRRGLLDDIPPAPNPGREQIGYQGSYSDPYRSEYPERRSILGRRPAEYNVGYDPYPDSYGSHRHHDGYYPPEKRPLIDTPYNSGQGRGDYPPVGRGGSFRGGGDFSRGRSDFGRGRGDFSRGRGDFSRGRGDGIGRGYGSRGGVEFGRGRGRGEVSRGRGDSLGRGRGEASSARGGFGSDVNGRGRGGRGSDASSVSSTKTEVKPESEQSKSDDMKLPDKKDSDDKKDTDVKASKLADTEQKDLPTKLAAESSQVKTSQPSEPQKNPGSLTSQTKAPVPTSSGLGRGLAACLMNMSGSTSSGQGSPKTTWEKSDSSTKSQQNKPEAGPDASGTQIQGNKKPGDEKPSGNTVSVNQPADRNRNEGTKGPVSMTSPSVVTSIVTPSSTTPAQTGKSPSTEKTFCEPCNSFYANSSQYNAHVRGVLHAKNMMNRDVMDKLKKTSEEVISKSATNQGTKPFNSATVSSPGTKPFNSATVSSPGTKPFHSATVSSPGTKPFHSATVSSPGTKPFHSATTSSQGTKPFNSAAASNPGTKLFHSTTTSSQEARPFQSASTSRPGTKPVQSAATSSPGTKPFQSAVTSSQGARPFQSAVTSSQGARSFQSAVTSSQGARPFQSVVTSSQGARPFQSAVTSSQGARPFQSAVTSSQGARPFQSAVTSSQGGRPFLSAANSNQGTKPFTSAASNPETKPFRSAETSNQGANPSTSAAAMESESDSDDDSSNCKVCNLSFEDRGKYIRHTKGLMHTQKKIEYEKKRGSTKYDDVPDSSTNTTFAFGNSGSRGRGRGNSFGETSAQGGQNYGQPWNRPQQSGGYSRQSAQPSSHYSDYSEYNTNEEEYYDASYDETYQEDDDRGTMNQLKDVGITDEMLAEANMTMPKQDPSERELRPEDVGRVQFPSAYHCKLCDAKCTSAVTFQSHLAGTKHKNNVAAVAKGTRKPKKKKPRPTIISLNRKSKIEELFAEEKETAIIGLNYITEFQKLDPKAITMCVCNLCESKCDENTVISHVVGLKHKIKYMREKHPVMYEHFKKFGGKKSKQTAFAEELARDVEKEDGRGAVNLKVELDEEDDDNDESVHSMESLLDLEQGYHAMDQGHPQPHSYPTRSEEWGPPSTQSSGGDDSVTKVMQQRLKHQMNITAKRYGGGRGGAVVPPGGNMSRVRDVRETSGVEDPHAGDESHGYGRGKKAKNKEYYRQDYHGQEYQADKYHSQDQGYSAGDYHGQEYPDQQYHEGEYNEYEYQHEQGGNYDENYQREKYTRETGPPSKDRHADPLIEGDHYSQGYGQHHDDYRGRGQGRGRSEYGDSYERSRQGYDALPYRRPDQGQSDSSQENQDLGDLNKRRLDDLVRRGLITETERKNMELAENVTKTETKIETSTPEPSPFHDLGFLKSDPDFKEFLKAKLERQQQQQQKEVQQPSEQPEHHQQQEEQQTPSEESSKRKKKADETLKVKKGRESPAPAEKQKPPETKGDEAVTGQIGELLQTLSSSMISSEDEAAVALQVSNALTQALLSYRLRSHPGEVCTMIERLPGPVPIPVQNLASAGVPNTSTNGVVKSLPNSRANGSSPVPNQSSLQLKPSQNSKSHVVKPILKSRSHVVNPLMKSSSHVVNPVPNARVHGVVLADTNSSGNGGPPRNNVPFSSQNADGARSQSGRAAVQKQLEAAVPPMTNIPPPTGHTGFPIQGYTGNSPSQSVPTPTPVPKPSTAQASYGGSPGATPPAKYANPKVSMYPPISTTTGYNPYLYPPPQTSTVQYPPSIDAQYAYPGQGSQTHSGSYQYPQGVQYPNILPPLPDYEPPKPPPPPPSF